jgi:hypothetical protein
MDRGYDRDDIRKVVSEAGWQDKAYEQEKIAEKQAKRKKYAGNVFARFIRKLLLGV